MTKERLWGVCIKEVHLNPKKRESPSAEKPLEGESDRKKEKAFEEAPESPWEGKKLGGTLLGSITLRKG